MEHDKWKVDICDERSYRAIPFNVGTARPPRNHASSPRSGALRGVDFRLGVRVCTRVVVYGLQDAAQAVAFPNGTNRGIFRNACSPEEDHKEG